MEINILPKFIDEGAKPPARAVGNTLADIWTLSIGNHVSLWTRKQELRHQKNLENYKQKIEQKTQAIPEEYVVEPQMHIIGPAMDASKYYIDSDELQEMFANLIAASIDNRVNKKAHPSFVEIIKQLSPLDAMNLALFTKTHVQPLGEYFITANETGTLVLLSNIFLSEGKDTDLALNAASVTNLERLGLLSVDFSKYLLNEELYNPFYETDYFKKSVFTRTTINHKGSTSEKIPSNKKIKLQKGLVSRTPLGEDFINVCI